jgi:hypothetical protein
MRDHPMPTLNLRENQGLELCADITTSRYLTGIYNMRANPKYPHWLQHVFRARVRIVTSHHARKGMPRHIQQHDVEPSRT